MKSYDAIVIGTGQAGPSLAAALAGAGMQVAVVERHRFGGTCVNVGCIPTKALVASAHAAHVARRAGEFGVVIGGDVSVDMAKVKARKDAIVRRSREGVEKWLRALDNVTVHTGHARFESPRTVRVEDRVLEADRIFINVGARAHVPSFPGLDRVPYRTNSGMMAVDFAAGAPRHHRRRLHRHRVRPDVPAVRQPRDADSPGRPAAPARVGRRVVGRQGDSRIGGCRGPPRRRLRAHRRARRPDCRRRHLRRRPAPRDRIHAPRGRGTPSQHR